MSRVADTRDTVGIDESVHGIYKELTEGKDPLSSPFLTMKDVFMWAACLGYRRGERRSLAGNRVTIFRWAQFTPRRDIPWLRGLAIAETGDVEVLQRQAEILMIAEEYANSGIHELHSSVLDEYGRPLWNLLDIFTKEPLGA
jgi:dnd system-associated protein 4